MIDPTSSRHHSVRTTHTSAAADLQGTIVPTSSRPSLNDKDGQKFDTEDTANQGGGRDRAGRRKHGGVVDDSLHAANMQRILRSSVPKNRPLKDFCKRVAENTHFSNFTTLLTLYALSGDDVRLIATDKPADIVFDILTITCLVFFSIEVIACSVGKEDYFLGFFFTLDVVSTLSLILDISIVSEYLFAGGEEGGASSSDSGEVARASRASRAGTKAGRVVRLVRLIRIVKLYKKAIEEQERKKKALAGKGATQNPGDDWDNLVDDDESPQQKESAVSKKLSEMTTRRVIVLVLTMLFSLPWFRVTAYGDTLAKSAQYGADAVFAEFDHSFAKWSPRENETRKELYHASRERQLYEETLIWYAYYHNWFSPQHDCHSSKLNMGAGRNCPADHFGGLFWIGVYGEDDYKKALVPPQHPDFHESTWNSQVLPAQGDDWFFSFGELPRDARYQLSHGWNDDCFDKITGVSLISSDEDGVKCPRHLRWMEKSKFTPHVATDIKDFNFFFVFDIRRQVQFECRLNICQTVFICILLGFGAMTFSKDANKLVLQPIERMIAKLEKIRNNPLEAMTIGDEEHRKEQKEASKRRSSWTKVSQMNLGSRQAQFRRMLIKITPAYFVAKAKKKPRTTEPMETVVLEKTIIKIGSLLALGFGEAGAEIIGQNMKGGESSALNAMIPGRKVDAIFGFCDIRNFTDATEVLQDQVMLFVNRIAGVVHQCIDDFFGAPNKNIGDAFLLVWRLSGQPPKKQQRLADMALLSFVKIIASINRSAVLAEYRNHPKLVKRMPNYRVRMGFGLHSGWAIEGAIGSEFKIDASYLSIHVDMASRLEAATKQFGVLMLISDALVELMSPALAEDCRLIDHIAVKGSKTPLHLYTFDLDDLALEVEKTKPAPATEKSKKHEERVKYRLRQERVAKKNERWRDSYNLYDLFEIDEDLIIMRRKFTSEFFCRFNMAFLNYEAGEWSVAREMLTSTRFLLTTEDGPSTALLKYMKEYDFKQPESWKGFRVFNDK